MEIVRRDHQEIAVLDVEGRLAGGISGGALKLLHLPERILDLLTATQLISMFEIFDDEDEALGSFA